MKKIQTRFYAIPIILACIAFYQDNYYILLISILAILIMLIYNVFNNNLNKINKYKKRDLFWKFIKNKIKT